MENSVFIRVNIEDELPTKSGNYLCTIKYPDGTLTVKKVFYLNEFKLRNGKKKCTIVNWFKRITVSDELFKQLNK